MIPAKAAGQVVLKARRVGLPDTLITEEAGLFEVSMSNTGNEPANVNALDGSFSDPLVDVLNSESSLLGEYPPSDKIVRNLGDLHGVLPPQPEQRQLAPGEQESWFASLWKYRDPLGPGDYIFRARHQLADGLDWTPTPSVPFRVVSAQVGAYALGYSRLSRMNSTLVWTAAPADGGGPSRILLRNSSLQSHSIVGEGATPLHNPTVPARLSVGHTPTDGNAGFAHWIAVTSPDGVELIQHSFTEAFWRSTPVPLGIAEPLPVPRFPDRGHAVYLATGRSPTGPVLVGIKIKPSQSNLVPWRVSLAHTPYLSAVSFGFNGPLAILLASMDGNSTVLSELIVDEDGRVLSPETVIRKSEARILALAVDMRPGAPPKFMALEADPHAHNRITQVHIPVAGRVDAAPSAPLPGWPVKIEDERTLPLPARQVALEISEDGAPWVALTDENENLYGGSLLDFHLKLLRPGVSPTEPHRKAIHPHIGALPGNLTISCFTETGQLFHFVAEARGGHSH